MKRKIGFNLRNVCGEYVLIAEGKENIDFSSIISMNETSAFLWEKIKDIDFDANLLAKYLSENYEVDINIAENDAKELIEQWTKAEIIE